MNASKKKCGLEIAMEEADKGMVIYWKSVDELLEHINSIAVDDQSGS